MSDVQGCTVVIFGAGGDLTRRKLVPALYHLYRDGTLPRNFALVGNARAPLTDEQFRAKMMTSLECDLPSGFEKESAALLISRFHYFSGDSTRPETYPALKKHLEKIDKESGAHGNMIFYLATPPQLFSQIPQRLGEVGLLSEEDGCFRRVILEKPFGRDYESARQLNLQLRRYLREDQIFRIDHYLGKETVQNIMAFRFANNTFEPLWNQHFIDSVQITVAESDGIDGRGTYYDSAGALRDMIPNHLFQLVSLIGMEPPNSFDPDQVRDEKVKVLQAIRPFTPESALRLVVRGQYGEPRRGPWHGTSPESERTDLAYRDEENVSPRSETETFVAMKLEIENWRWAGVPFFLRTGKRLFEHETHIVIQFRHVPVQMFRELVAGVIEPNLLTLQIYPREEISLRLAAKIPGTTLRLGGVNMVFDYEDEFGMPPKTGYETLIYDAITGDRTLFQRADQVEAAWQVVSPILKSWESCQCPVFPNYPSGSWGPSEAQALLAQDGHYWRELEFPRRMQPLEKPGKKAA